MEREQIDQSCNFLKTKEIFVTTMQNEERRTELDIENSQSGGQKKILDFEPMFTEIKIISDTFFLLQEVINYKSNILENHANVADSIVHFAYARQTFKQLNNSYGQIISLINLAYFQIQQQNCLASPINQDKFNSIISTFDCALQYAMSDLGISNFTYFKKQLLEGTLRFSNRQDCLILNCIYQILLLKGRLLKDTSINLSHEQSISSQINSDFNQANQQSYISLLTEARSLFEFLLHILTFFKQAVLSQLDNLENEKILLKLDIAEVNILLHSLRDPDIDILQLVYEQSIQITQQFSQFNQYQIQQSPIQHFNNSYITESQQFEKSKQCQAIDIQCCQSICMVSSRLSYLKGLIYFKNNLYYEACDSLTLIQENSYFIDWKVQKKGLQILNEIFKLKSLPNNQIQKLLNKEKYPARYDIQIFIEGNAFDISPVGQLFTTLNHIKSKFLSKQDRVSLYVYNQTNIVQVQPLILIKTQRVWEFSLQNLLKTLISFNNMSPSEISVRESESVVISNSQQNQEQTPFNVKENSDLLTTAFQELSHSNLIHPNQQSKFYNCPNSSSPYSNNNNNKKSCNKKEKQKQQDSEDEQEDDEKCERKAIIIVISIDDQSNINKIINSPSSSQLLLEKFSIFSIKVKLLHTLASIYDRHKDELEHPQYINHSSFKKAKKIYQFNSLNQLKSYLIMKRPSF